MKTIDVLKFAKGQLIHLEDHMMGLDKALHRDKKDTLYTYPLTSNTGALVLIDMAIQEDVESRLISQNQELMTALEACVTRMKKCRGILQDSSNCGGNWGILDTYKEQEIIDKYKP